MEINVLGIDIAKQVFHLCGLNRAGKVVLRKKVTRIKLTETVLQSGAQLIAIEACGGAHHWARTFQQQGMTVKLIAPQFVKPYVKSNKNDSADAEAIAEAASRPTMRFVSIKTVEQQDLQTLHRIRERSIKQRTALSNEIRGFLSEYGIVLPQGLAKLKQFFSVQLQDCEELSETMKQLLTGLYGDFTKVDSKIMGYDRKLKIIAKNHPIANKLMTIPGIGVVCATATIAAVASPSDFKNGRYFAAWLGLTPRQHSSGGKNKLLGISKRGNSYLRKQLVHGARSVVYFAKGKDDPASAWINKLRERAGNNKTVVACANKNARILWSIMARDNVYQPCLAH